VTRTEPFGVLNAFVSLSSPDGKWNTRLYGKNLTEEEYYTIGLALVSGIRVPSEPRTWGLEVRYNF
jgi:outer membrane receptor protein involved in Fe transport